VKGKEKVIQKIQIKIVDRMKAGSVLTSSITGEGRESERGREREREAESESVTSFVLKGQSQALDLKLK